MANLGLEDIDLLKDSGSVNVAGDWHGSTQVHGLKSLNPALMVSESFILLILVTIGLVGSRLQTLYTPQQIINFV